jgi:hypothetical protein
VVEKSALYQAQSVQELAPSMPAKYAEHSQQRQAATQKIRRPGREQ